jgi:cell division protein FtsQ
MEARKGKQSHHPSHHPFQYLTQALKITLLGTLVLSCIFALNQIKWSSYFPIKTVRVYGVNRVDPQEVQGLLFPLVSRGFFTINVDYIRDRLLQMPWVSTLYVRRVWPDQVDITVVEKSAIARWNEESLLSGAGELFSPKRETYPMGLPDFVGPAGKQIMMLQYFNEINRLLMPLHAKMSYLELTPYFTWKLKLDNGMTIQIGHKDSLTRFDHFVKVYPKIVGGREADVDYIDLRYPNGVAVRWKETAKT